MLLTLIRVFVEEEEKIIAFQLKKVPYLELFIYIWAQLFKALLA